MSDSKVSSLTAANALTGAELFYADDGTNDVKVTANQIKTFAGGGAGTVTSVAMTVPNVLSVAGSPVTTSGTFAVTLANQNANIVWAGPTIGAAAAPTFRSLVAADIPTLNQSTTGSAATLTTTRAIYGNNFDGSAALTQVIASTFGGTGNGFAKLSGPASTEKTFTLPNASSAILTDNAAVTVAQGGTGLATLTANNVILGNGTSAPTFVAPGSSGNVLTSNGSTWQSTAAAGGSTAPLVLSTNAVDQRNSTNAQKFSVYGSYTDASNYWRAVIDTTGGSVLFGREVAGTGAVSHVKLQYDGSNQFDIGNGSVQLYVGATYVYDWNFNYANKLTFGVDTQFTPSASVTPSANGILGIEKTSNTTLTFKLKGSDGVVRSGTITLS